jgi:hypothetical protein
MAKQLYFILCMTKICHSEHTTIWRKLINGKRRGTPPIWSSWRATVQCIVVSLLFIIVVIIIIIIIISSSSSSRSNSSSSSSRRKWERRRMSTALYFNCRMIHHISHAG